MIAPDFMPDEPPKPTLGLLRRRWPDLVLRLKADHPQVCAMAGHAVPARLEDRTLTLLVDYSVHAQMLLANPEPVCQMLSGEYGGVWSLRCEVLTEPAAWLADRAPASDSVAYTISFTPDEDGRLAAEATRRGVNPIELIRNIVTAALP